MIKSYRKERKEGIYAQKMRGDSYEYQAVAASQCLRHCDDAATYRSARAQAAQHQKNASRRHKNAGEAIGKW